MANDLKCPECGARAILGGDRLFCQGVTDATDAIVADAERAVKVAMSRGTDLANADATWRALSAQRVCGKIASMVNGAWVIPGYTDRGN